MAALDPDFEILIKHRTETFMPILLAISGGWVSQTESLTTFVTQIAQAAYNRGRQAAVAELESYNT